MAKIMVKIMPNDQIFWLKKKSGTRLDAKYDIIVKKSVSAKKPHTYIYVRDDIAKKMTTTQYVEIGVCKSKLYFRQSESSLGYKLSRGCGKYHQIKLNFSTLPIDKGNIESGNYKIKSDSNGFYIDVLNKE